MTQEHIQQLNTRNKRIIKAIITKAQTVCPDSIALIGVAGSFCSGDIHERSDLDLCIVINDDEGWKIASCFILDEVGHDIYCTPWSRLEAMAEYTSPYITKLLQLDIVYCVEERYAARYMALRKKVQDKLDAPFSIEDAQNVTRHLEKAIQAYADIMLNDTVAQCKYASAKMLVSLEYAIYLANKSYIRRGVRRIPEEIRTMEQLPENFLNDYQNLLSANSQEEIQSCSTRIIKTTRAFVTALAESVTVKKNITRQSLEGIYEEIFSNWRNKMYLAAHNDNAYLSLMTMTSCQELYDELATEYNIERVRLFESFRIDELGRSAEAFDAAMERFRRFYIQVGEPVKYYPTIETFEKAYLECE